MSSPSYSGYVPLPPHPPPHLPLPLPPLIPHAAPPTITDLRITGDMSEGEEVTVEGEFVWGEEGDSLVDWYFTAQPEAISLSDFHEIECEPRNSRALIVPVDAVGCFLAVRYTPVRVDGEKGKPVVAISQETVAGEAVATGEAHLVSRSLAFTGVRTVGHRLNGHHQWCFIGVSASAGTAGHRLYLCVQWSAVAALLLGCSAVPTNNRAPVI